jgi:predicted RNA polymerase sigma factor
VCEPFVDEAMRGAPGPFALQAAIAAVHARAKRKEDTDWAERGDGVSRRRAENRSK